MLLSRFIKAFSRLNQGFLPASSRIINVFQGFQGFMLWRQDWFQKMSNKSKRNKNVILRTLHLHCVTRGQKWMFHFRLPVIFFPFWHDPVKCHTKKGRLISKIWLFHEIFGDMFLMDSVLSRAKIITIGTGRVLKFRCTCLKNLSLIHDFYFSSLTWCYYTKIVKGITNNIIWMFLFTVARINRFEKKRTFKLNVHNLFEKPS